MLTWRPRLPRTPRPRTLGGARTEYSAVTQWPVTPSRAPMSAERWSRDRPLMAAIRAETGRGGAPFLSWAPRVFFVFFVCVSVLTH